MTILPQVDGGGLYLSLNEVASHTPVHLAFKYDFIGMLLSHNKFLHCFLPDH